MRLLLAVFIVLFSGFVSAGSISIFGKKIEFEDGEFINPYESHVDSRGALSIVINRSCKGDSECSGEVIIGPIKEPSKIASNYSSYSEPKFTSSCPSNILLKKYHDHFLSIYHTSKYEYYVMYVGSKSNFHSFEKKLCAK